MNLLMKIIFLGFLAFAQADDCKCRLKTLNRINNGDVSVEHEMPWIVSLGVKNKHLCGGSILNNKFILTLTGCVEKLKPESIQVRVGINNVKDEVPKNQVYDVKKIHIPKSRQSINVAILELKTKINFVDGVIEKGCYNIEKKEYDHEFLGAGFGYTGTSYKNLKNNEMTYNGNPDKLTYAYYTEDKSNSNEFTIAMKPNEKKQSNCFGDSGSPLHYTENGITKIEGVVSYMSGITEEDTTTFCTSDFFYSRLSYYADFLNKVTGNDYCGSNKKVKRFGLF